MRPLTHDELKRAITFAVKECRNTPNMSPDELLVYIAALTGSDESGAISESDLLVRLKEVRAMLPSLRPWLMERAFGPNWGN